jgi:thiamine biosynthesis lipoprotein
MLHRLPFRAMGCEMLAILDQDSESAPEILESVPGWFESWEQSLSRFRPDSELTRLNKTYDQPVEVSEVLWNVFQTAQWAHQFTGGLVTPTILDAIIDAGYDRPFDDLPQYQSTSLVSTLTQIQPLSMIVADERTQSICLPQGVHLDFGGVAKGWAARETVEKLKEFGPCLMNAGGDIAVSGPQANGKPWPVGVSNAFEAGTDLEVLYLKRCGIASSGKDRRNWHRNGLIHHHIINPLTGQPAETDLLRVTVVAPTVMEAEAAAKAAFILGRSKGMAWIEADSALAGLFILDNGEVFSSTRMQEYS